MYIGVDYYPEHWPHARWRKDAAMMREAGFNIVRLAEFAWVFMEPQKGVFTFDWLDEIIGILGQKDIKVILGTPTGAMPAWIAADPECLAMQSNGQRMQWGVRKNNCFSTPVYRAHSARITRAMAMHYAKTPNVIGWQTDNEFGGPDACFCPLCRAEFQGWLKRRYKSLDALNTAWGTHFWGHRFSTWEQIYIPDDVKTHNPSLCLDWKRFNSWLNVRFQAEQVAILRKTCPDQFVTHNFMGLFSELDYYDLAKDLDFVSWDNYPVWGKPSISYDAAMAADVMRGLKRKNFWIMEQTAGPGGWTNFGRNPRPGEIRKIAFQQVAHGADAIIWFRWRTCTAGREQYWHGLLGHDGKAGRRYREAAKTATDLHKLAPAFEGTTVKADVAMIYDYDSCWATNFQPGFPQNNLQEAMRRYYQPLFRAGVAVDMVKPGASLDRYKIVLAPDLMVMPDALARKLERYVRNGGTFLMDCRSAVKTETSLCHDRTLPGLLSDALGIAIEEYETLDDAMLYPLSGVGAMRGTFTATRYTDWITPRRAEVMVRYDQWHITPCAAVTRNTFGRGKAWYVGTVVKEQEFYDLLMKQVLKSGGVTPVLTPPDGVEASVRQGQGRKLLFLVNHLEEPRTVKLPRGARLAVGGKEPATQCKLPAYGVAVYRI